MTRRAPRGWGATAIAPALLLLAALPGCGDGAEPPPVLFQVPDFALTDQDGHAVRASDLEGRIWIADFIFTHCPTICPTLTTQMGNLARRLDAPPDELRFVSFSVDPQNDTPEVLRAYGTTYGADFARWSFLTGDRDHVRATIVDGLRVRMGDPGSGPPGATDILHASHFVLVDRERRVRGYYPSDGEGLRNLERDARRLLEERP